MTQIDHDRIHYELSNLSQGPKRESDTSDIAARIESGLEILRNYPSTDVDDDFMMACDRLLFDASQAADPDKGNTELAIHTLRRMKRSLLEFDLGGTLQIIERFDRVHNFCRNVAQGGMPRMYDIPPDTDPLAMIGMMKELERSLDGMESSLPDGDELAGIFDRLGMLMYTYRDFSFVADYTFEVRKALLDYCRMPHIDKKVLREMNRFQLVGPDLKDAFEHKLTELELEELVQRLGFLLENGDLYMRIYGVDFSNDGEDMHRELRIMGDRVMDMDRNDRDILCEMIMRYSQKDPVVAWEGTLGILEKLKRNAFGEHDSTAPKLWTKRYLVVQERDVRYAAREELSSLGFNEEEIRRFDKGVYLMRTIYLYCNTRPPHKVVENRKDNSLREALLKAHEVFDIVDIYNENSAPRFITEAAAQEDPDEQRKMLDRTLMAYALKRHYGLAVPREGDIQVCRPMEYFFYPLSDRWFRKVRKYKGSEEPIVERKNGLHSRLLGEASLDPCIKIVSPSEFKRRICTYARGIHL